MSNRLWNNQGGSDFHGGSKKKDRIKKPEDPFKRKSIDELKESEVTSFRLIKPRKVNPNYGDFGDAVWVFDLIPDDIKDLDDPYRFSDLSTTQPTEAKPFRETEDIRDVPADKNSDQSRFVKSGDLIPYSVKDEYELIVKFKKVILTISSGQAFAARNRINDPKYDKSIVIQSTEPITLSTSVLVIEQNTTPGTVNIIQLKNGNQDPIESLYNWMMTKNRIVTDGSGKNVDVELLTISRRDGGIRLPQTSFSYDDKDYGLFYVSKGIQPYQICMHARNDVLKYVAGNPKDDRYWSVLNANKPKSLCTPNLPTVSIEIDPDSESELEAGSDERFILIVKVDPTQSGDTLVEYEIEGTADSQYYEVTGTGTDSDGIPIVNIPNINNKLVFIKPLENNIESENKTIIFKLKENDRYLIEDESVELTILPKTKPKVSIKLAPTSQPSLGAGSGLSFVLEASTDIVLQDNLLVEYEILSAVDPAFYNVTGVTIDPNNITVIDIPSTNNQQVFIEPLANSDQTTNETIVLKLKPGADYLIDPMFEEVTLTVVYEELKLQITNGNDGIKVIPRSLSHPFSVQFTQAQAVFTNVRITIIPASSINDLRTVYLDGPINRSRSFVFGFPIGYRLDFSIGLVNRFSTKNNKFSVVIEPIPTNLCPVIGLPQNDYDFAG